MTPAEADLQQRLDEANRRIGEHETWCAAAKAVIAAAVRVLAADTTWMRDAAIDQLGRAVHTLAATETEQAASLAHSPLCAVCGKGSRDGKHATDLGEGHDYEPRKP